MSKRMREFVKRKEAVKNVKQLKIQQRKVHDDFKASDSLTNKSTKRDLRRIENDLKKRKLEAQFATKYNVQIVRDEKTGEIKVKKDFGKLKQKKELLNAAKLRIQQEEKLKSSTEKKEVVIPKDDVAFGEVNKQPPNLIVPKKSKKITNKKAWQKGNLILFDKIKWIDVIIEDI